MTTRNRPTGSLDVSWGRASDFSQSHERNSEFEEQELHKRNTHDSFRLPHFKTSLFATILEDTITQLYILGECNSELQIQKTLIDMPDLLAHKYSIEKKSVQDELDEIDPKNLGCSEHKLRKLKSDRYFVAKFLQDTYSDLANHLHFDALTETIGKIIDNQNYLKHLIEMEFKNKIFRRDLKRQLRLQRNHIKSQTYDTDNRIERVKSQIEDAELNSELRKRYVGSWQRARTEQHMHAISDKEVGPYQIIKDLKRKTDQEQRVHTEIELLVNIKINELLTQVEQWMQKFDKDMEHLDLKIQLKKNDYDHTYDKRIELEQTLETHAKLIEDWVKFKEEREAARQYREKMNNAAIIVQAWWRGLLVRQRLGPYKTIKKKGQVLKSENKAGKKNK